MTIETNEAGCIESKGEKSSKFDDFNAEFGSIFHVIKRRCEGFIYPLRSWEAENQILIAFSHSGSPSVVIKSKVDRVELVTILYIEANEVILTQRIGTEKGDGTLEMNWTDLRLLPLPFILESVIHRMARQVSSYYDKVIDPRWFF